MNYIMLDGFDRFVLYVIQLKANSTSPVCYNPRIATVYKHAET